MEWKNIWDYFTRKSEQYSRETALIHKKGDKWVSLTYRQYYNKVVSLASGMYKTGVRPGSKVAIYAPNSPEWKYSYLATMANAATMIPIDNKMSIPEFSHIMNSSQADTLIISHNEINDRLISTLEKIDSLEKTILIDCSQETVKKFNLPQETSKSREKQKKAFAKFRRKGKTKNLFYCIEALYHKDTEKYTPPALETNNEPASIIYTSGTMGIPKGVMLTHQNFLINMQQIEEFLSKHLDLSSSDRLLLVLPLNHSYAFTANFLLPILRGMSVIFVESLTRVTQNASEQRPTILIAVPLLLEKMHGRILEQLQKSFIKKGLFRFSWFKKTVGKKFKEKLGGKLRFIISGGAPLDPQICRDFWDMNIPVLQGYGMTEASPVISVNPPSKPKYASVGIPLPGIEAKIAQSDKEGTGELVIKGENIMKGYYNMPEETARILKDGWLYTGDQGYIDDENYIFIKGRKKNIIVNREGKNIHPEEIEIILNESPFIMESLVLGYKDTDTPGEKVGAIIVPDLEYFESWSKEKNLSLSDEVLESVIQEEVSNQCRDIASFKVPRKIKIRSEPFQKTPTQKIKRSLYDF